MKIEIFSQEKKMAPRLTIFGWVRNSYWDILGCFFDDKLVEVKNAEISVEGSIEVYYGMNPKALTGPNETRLTITIIDDEVKYYIVSEFTIEMLGEKIRKIICEVEEEAD